jgi:pristinamycin I synthase-3/4
VYNVTEALRLRGGVDRDAVGLALRDTMLRQESLRTVFVDHGGVPWQRVLGEGEFEVPLDVVELGEGELAGRMTAASETSFDLGTELPFRVWVYVVGAQECVVLFVMHHIAMDGWSLRPLFRDLSVAYEARVDGRAPVWDSLPAQYADYADWQREMLGSESDPDSVISTQLKYWRQALAGIPDELALPYDRPRPAVGSYRGGVVPIVLEAPLHEALARLAQRTGTSLYMVFQAGLAVVLSRLGAGHDIPIGGPTTDRVDEALDDVIGFFVNTLVFRIDTTGDPTFTELLRRVRQTDLDALSHRDVPFDRVVEELNPQRSLSRNALFQVLLMLEESGAGVEFPGVSCVAEPVESPLVRFDLWLGLSEAKTASGECLGVTGEFRYSGALFDHATIDNLVSLFLTLLRDFAADPERHIEPGTPRTLTIPRRKPVKLSAEPSVR